MSLLYRVMSMTTIVVHTLVIPISIILTGIIAAFPLFWPILGLYALIIVFDSRPEQGIPLQWFQKYCRRLWWWKAFASYYPIKLHKTVDLQPSDPPLITKSSWTSISPWSWPDLPLLIILWPVVLVYKGIKAFRKKPAKVLPPTEGRRYIFGVSPHGIISMGAFCAISTEGANWSKLFPGIPVRLLTLSSNFYFPFYRQYLTAIGVASVSKQSCINHLRNNQSIAIVLGGARESLLAVPNKFDLVLKNRKGFVKVALQTGSCLVPVLSFGENDIYEQVRFSPDSWGHKIHIFMTKYFGFTIPLFHARGVFNHSKGIIAYRRPINVVVGEPIEVPLVLKPTQKEINYYHAKYVRSLQKLYSENVDKYTPGIELRILD